MRSHSFVVGNFYHIYTHGVADFPIFRQTDDYVRFMSLLFCANGNKSIPRLDWEIDYLSQAWEIRDQKVDIGKPIVGLVAFSLMTTHVHLLLRERSEGGISGYLHKILTSHAKYFNLKYDRRGHVFEGKFNSRYIDSNRYLLYVSRYIHRNHKKLSDGSRRLESYPWSSYQDFVSNNRWKKLLNMEPIVSQFNSPKEYQHYVISDSEESYKVDF
ncbi:MAG: transposase [Minisyncoccia bacterium]